MNQKTTVIEPYVNKIYNFIILRKLNNTINIKPNTFQNFKTLFLTNISATAHYSTSAHVFFQNEKNSPVNITNVIKNQ